MEKILNEQIEPSAQATEVEKNQGAKEGEISLGKFKDVNALLSAYNSLQAEFTKRCQRLKELEDLIKPADKTVVPTETTDKSTEDERQKSITPKEKEEILKEYLKEILSSKSKAIVLDGVGTSVKTPQNKPKTIEEAGLLAKEFLNTKIK